MRIAILCQSYPPMISGASLYAGSLAEGLVARGHQVLVVAASDTGKAYVETRGHLSVIRVSSRPNPLRAAQRMAIWPFQAVLCSLAAFRPEVIHLHTVAIDGIAGILAGKRLGAPVLLTAHQLPAFVLTYLGIFSFAAPIIERLLWRYTRFLDRYTRIVAPTAAAAAVIEKKSGVLAEVISYGLDFNRFHSRPLTAEERSRLCARYGLDPARPILLHVGRLDLDKKVHIVIEAAARALKNTDAQLVVVGDGQQRSALERLASRLGLDGRAHFTGFVLPADGLADLYRAASVFAFASEIETQGLVVLEAMASGLPVVAVRATCIPEIVRDGRNGFLVAPEDVGTMADKLTLLLQDPAKAEVLGAAGAEIAGRYSQKLSIDRYVVVYNRLLEEMQPVVEA